ncbi:Porphobilinogen deaminase [compost metagenome]
MAIDCRQDDAKVIALVSALDDAPTRTCVEAERAMNRALDGSCHVPVAGLAQWEGQDLWLQGLVGGVADGRIVRAEARGPATDPEALGRNVARQLLDAGAGELLGNPV